MEKRNVTIFLLLMFDIACGFDLAELMHYGQLHNPIAYKALTNQLNHLHSQFYPHEAIKNDRPLYDRLRLGYPGLSRIHNFGSVGIPVARPDGRSSVAQSSAIPDKFGMMKGMLKPFQAPITSVGSNNAFGIIPLDERAMNYLLYRRLITPKNPFEGYRQSALREKEMVMRHAKSQSVKMAEQYLSMAGSTEDQICAQRSFCDIACLDETSVELKDETVTAATETIRVMEKMIAVARQETSNYVAKQKHPHIAQLIGSYKVGKLTKDKSLCKSLFPCDDSDEQIQARQFSCKQIGKICPGVSLTCGLCGVLSPESCAAVCPVAATFCGISGYACVVEKLQAAQEESSKDTVSNKELNDNDTGTDDNLEDKAVVETVDTVDLGQETDVSQPEARIASVPITIEGKTVEPMEPKSSLTDTQDEKKPADETEQKITFDWKEEVHSPDE